MVEALAPLFRTAGHLVHTQRRVFSSACQKRGDVEIVNIDLSPSTRNKTSPDEFFAVVDFFEGSAVVFLILIHPCQRRQGAREWGALGDGSRGLTR